MSDTSSNSGWADFGGNVFANAASGRDPFSRSSAKVENQVFTTDFTSVFSGATTQKDSSSSVFEETTTTPTTTSNQEAFKADFSNVNFDTVFETNCDDQKNTVSSASDPQSRSV